MTNSQFVKVCGWIDEMDRLDAMSTAELIHEVIDSGALDNQFVVALVRRIDPLWDRHYDDNGEPTPGSGLRPFTPDPHPAAEGRVRT